MYTLNSTSVRRTQQPGALSPENTESLLLAAQLGKMSSLNGGAAQVSTTPPLTQQQMRMQQELVEQRLKKQQEIARQQERLQVQLQQQSHPHPNSASPRTSPQSMAQLVQLQHQLQGFSLSQKATPPEMSPLPPQQTQPQIRESSQPVVLEMPSQQQIVQLQLAQLAQQQHQQLQLHQQHQQQQHLRQHQQHHHQQQQQQQQQQRQQQHHQQQQQQQTHYHIPQPRHMTQHGMQTPSSTTPSRHTPPLPQPQAQQPILIQLPIGVSPQKPVQAQQLQQQQQPQPIQQQIGSPQILVQLAQQQPQLQHQLQGFSLSQKATPPEMSPLPPQQTQPQIRESSQPVVLEMPSQQQIVQLQLAQLAQQHQQLQLHQQHQQQQHLRQHQQHHHQQQQQQQQQQRQQQHHQQQQQQQTHYHIPQPRHMTQHGMQTPSSTTPSRHTPPLPQPQAQQPILIQLPIGVPPQKNVQQSTIETPPMSSPMQQSDQYHHHQQQQQYGPQRSQQNNPRQQLRQQRPWNDRQKPPSAGTWQQPQHQQRSRRFNADSMQSRRPDNNNHGDEDVDVPKNPTSSCHRDVQFVQEFKNRYAIQADDESRAEHLRTQANSPQGVVGTLDIEHCKRLIADNDVTIVVTDTGTGKSTLIPRAILDANPDAKIVNAQPRRTPAIKLAQRVASLYGERIGEKVGYWVRGEHVGTVGETPIMYVTNYTLFLHMLHFPPDEVHITHIIFDEFHERTLEVEVLLLMMKLVMRRNPGRLKLVLCSATAEVSHWVRFFDKMKVGEYSKANSMYTVHEYYLEDVCRLVGVSFNEPSMSLNGIVQSTQLHSINFYIKELLKFLATTVSPQHSILIFVPGRTVVEQLVAWVRENLGDQLDPIPWYRDIELSFIQEALQRESVTKKKVYIATDIAEVSLTLPDVVFVIDSGTAKRPHIIESNPNSVAFPPLELVWESSVNLLQRRGRAGRVQQGFFFTMLSREQVNLLSPSESRLGNAVLHEIVLHSLHLTQSPFVMFSLCREEPRKVSVQLSLSTLCDGGYVVPIFEEVSKSEELKNEAHICAKKAWSSLIADACKISAAHPDGNDASVPNPLRTIPNAHLRYNVTLKGLVVGGLPFGVEPGTIVFNGLITGLTTLSIIAAACVSCKTPFYVPYRVTDRLERLRLLGRVESVMNGFKGGLHNDALSAVGAVISYMAMQCEGLSEEGQVAWCEERYLSRTRIVDILLVVRQTKEQLASILPFEDVKDNDELAAQYEEHTLTLSLICCAAHMHHGIYVLHDKAMAEKKRFAGSGVFVNINCCRDRSVPTVCPWRRETVCVPFSLQTIYGRLVGSFSAQLLPEVFNVMLLLFTYRLVHDEIAEDAESVLFEVSQSGSCVYLSCDRITALQLLHLRRLTCARLCVIHFLMQREVSPSDTEAIADCLKSTKSDFGIPKELQGRPDFLPRMITSTVTKVVQRIDEATRAKGDKLKEPMPFCRAAEKPPEFRPTRQSLLIFSSNGCGPYEAPMPPEQPPSAHADPNAGIHTVMQ